MNCLVVESSATTRRTVANELRAHGCREIVERFTPRDEGTAESGLALLVVEWAAGNDDALDLIRRVRAGEQGAATRVLVLTTRHERRDVERAAELKVDDYLLKPFAPEVLRSRLAVLLEPPGNEEQQAA